MYHFSIIEPFSLNWKYVAPKSFDVLEVFIKPGLSLELHGISNGPKKFAIGAYMTNGNHQNKFNNEILPNRSDERIALAFSKEEVSAFFTPEDAEALAKLFEEEEFICRQVTVHSKEHGIDLFSYPAEDFNLVMELMSQLNVQQTADIKESRELFEDLRTEAHKEAEKKVRAEHRATMSGTQTKKSKKDLKLKAVAGTVLLAISGTFTYAAKKLKNRGFFAALGGLALNIVASLTGVAGANIMSGAAETFVEGGF